MQPLASLGGTDETSVMTKFSLRVFAVSYVHRARRFDTLHKKTCRIGPGLRELPRTPSRRRFENSPSTSFGE